MQILGGSLNLLTPGDKTPSTDYLLAQNFRTDSLGRLVSRPGYPQQIWIEGAGIAHSAASMGGPDSQYYVGCNSGITAPTGALYYVGAEIATGFDGNRIGFASQNGAMWVMNRGKQGRHDPAGGFVPYGLTPPPASPTAAVGTGGSVQGSVAFVYNPTGNRAYVHFLTIAGVTYSTPEGTLTIVDGYNEIAATIASLAGADPNSAVTYPGTGNNVEIWPTPPNILIPVSGSDENGSVNLANGPVTSLPNGTYQFYLTFESADFSLESNPSPVSASVTVVSAAIDITIPPADAPVDPRIGYVNIYATGGTLGQAYRVGQVASTVANPATTFSYTIPDLQVTNNGIVMSIVNGLPPACSGIIGPQWSRLYAWSTAANRNRVFYTQPDLPQYWNTDPEIGDWFDVGLEDEDVVWCTIHQNLLVIYKERSIWLMIGDPATGTLEQAYDGLGLCGQFALTPAGQIDYFVASNGLCLFDMAQVHALGSSILPLFNQSIVNAGPLTSPGSVLPGSAFNSNSLACYAIALGHAMGRLYISYAEQVGPSMPPSYNLLVFDEGPEPERNAYLAAQRSGRWFYHRNKIANTLNGFFDFFFDGISMIGLTGIQGGAAQGYSLADFRRFLTPDWGDAVIETVYQSHFEDAGKPDIPKVWLEVVIDLETSSTGGAIYVAFNNGVGPDVPDQDEPPNFHSPALWQIGGYGTQQRAAISYALPGGGIEAKNISVALLADSAGPVTIHNVYLYYYEEARLAILASSLPTDLGVGKVKQCKELQLDIDSTGGDVQVTLMSDLPGNALQTRQLPIVAQRGRAVFKYPFPVTEGFLWKLIFYGPSYFRLYSARLLMRVLGVFVEGYESAAGFLWDSMQQDLGDPEDKTFDQLRFEMDADGPVSVTMLTDLPGEAYAVRGTFVLTTGATSRAWVTVPLPPNGLANQNPIEGRGVQLQVIGPSAYRLYSVEVRWSRVGRYLCALTPSGFADAFNTLEFDYSSERRKVFKRIEIDLRADAVVNMSVITDQDGDKLAAVYAPQIQTPNGRTTVLVAMPPGIRGRLMRLLLTGPAPARIYRIRVWCRELTNKDAAWGWVEFPLEGSDVLSKWTNLIAEETPPTWQLVDVDVSVVDG